MRPPGRGLANLDRSGLDVDELLVSVLQVVMDGFERLLVVALEEAGKRQQVQVSCVLDGLCYALLLELWQTGRDPGFDGRSCVEEFSK